MSLKPGSLALVILVAAAACATSSTTRSTPSTATVHGAAGGVPNLYDTQRLIDEYISGLSLGNQNSDLLGGYAERTFKLPNPVYFLP
jgi:hypothetical protein